MKKSSHTKARGAACNPEAAIGEWFQEKEWRYREMWVRKLNVLIWRHSHLGITQGDLLGMTLEEMEGLYKRLLRESGSGER